MDIYNIVKKYTALTEKEINWLIESSTNAPSGDIVIAGTYHGGDAMSIILSNPSRKVHVIDSFDGLAAPVTEDIVEQNKHNVTTMEAKEFSIGGFKKYKENFKEVNIKLPKCYEMFITEESIKEVKVKDIAMLWLDLDHYAPTKVCLDYFKDNLVDNAIIGCHDYGFVRCPGVKPACDSFSSNWSHATGGIFKVINDE